MIERVMVAINSETGVGLRVNKSHPLPYEVIDRTGEPQVMSRWGSLAEADAECEFQRGYRRARAAIEALREPNGPMKDAGAETYGIHNAHIGLLPNECLDGQPSKAWRMCRAAHRQLLGQPPDPPFPVDAAEPGREPRV
jgi:hypothetical protein